MSGIAAGDLQALLIADQTIAPPAPQAARCVTLASWPWRRQINEWISIQHNAWPEGGQQRQLAEQYERWATSDEMGEGTRDSINGSFAWKTYCARSNSIKKSSLLSLCLSLSHSASSSLSLFPFSVAPSRVCLVSNWPRACVFLGCRCWCWRCKRHAISGCKYLKYSIAAWRTYMESGSMFGLFTARPASYSPKGCQEFRLRASSENIRLPASNFR